MNNFRFSLAYAIFIMVSIDAMATDIAAREKVEEQCDIEHIFTSGENGYSTFRIPSLIMTPNKTLLAVCAARKNNHKDWGDIDIALRRSTDEGNTWDDFRILADADDQVADNATLIYDTITDTIHMLYQVGYARAYHIFSKDEGLTWSEPSDITAVFERYRHEENYPWKVIAVGPGHGIQLRNGRMIAPIWLATDKSHRPSIASTIYSDDHGKTWQRGDVVVANTLETPNPSESVAIELADGSVMLNTRCESKKFRRVISISKDGATGWTKPRFQEDLFDPVCMASLARLSQSGTHDKNRILFSNPDSEHTPISKSGKHDRVNLTIRLSDDEGNSWPVARSLVDGPSGYSDLAVGSNGIIYCLFENQNASDDPQRFIPKHISLARVNLAWLTHGKDQLKNAKASHEVP